MPPCTEMSEYLPLDVDYHCGSGAPGLERHVLHWGGRRSDFAAGERRLVTGWGSDTVPKMAPVHHQDRRRQHRDDDCTQLAPPGELGEELLARAVTAALTQGASWAQIGARLGVPHPCAPDREDSDRQWQDAIVDHENARAQRIHTTMPGPSSAPGR